MAQNKEPKPRNGTPLGLRLPPPVIVEFKQEAKCLGLSASALFLKMWAERDKDSRS